MNPIDRRDFLVRAAGTLGAVAIAPSLEAVRFAAGASAEIAVIGVGRQGQAIAAELATIEAARVVALCDPDDRRLAAGKRRVPDAAAYADHRELLDKHPALAAVVVATPTHTHRAIVDDALSAGRHVYCEAPLAHTVDDARAIAAAARKSGRVFQSGLTARSNPVYKLARSFFRSDSVRDPVGLAAGWARKTSWRTPAGDPARDRALNWRLDPDVSPGLAGELGTQQFETFHYFLDRFPIAVTGRGGILANADGRSVPDTIACTLEFDRGLCAQYDATLGNSYLGEWELFRGTNAAIRLAQTHGWMFKEADAPTQGWEVYANRQQFHKDEGITLIADATQLASQGKLQDGVGLPRTPTYYALADFLKSILENAPVVCTAEDGLRATIVGLLANRAVVTGQRIEIDHALFSPA